MQTKWPRQNTVLQTSYLVYGAGRSSGYERGFVSGDPVGILRIATHYFLEKNVYSKVLALGILD